ncbi:class B sortase [Streptococcus suis]
MEGTRIDYPVAQHPTDDSYYLSHDSDGAETYYGAIFTELFNTKTFEYSVTILYGHAMVDDSMFGSLDYFTDQQFLRLIIWEPLKPLLIAMNIRLWQLILIQMTIFFTTFS